ncbi:MAG: peptide ABC transporter substrate-binding protein, partial [Planctomycetales bacterium]
MHWTTRKLFPYATLFLLIGSTCWALWYSPPQPAEFTFNNLTEVKSVDPARVTGAPEGRLIRMLFEGLYRPDPRTLEPLPGLAVSADPAKILSKDGRTYTFTIRRGANWSDGTPVTAEDFRWSWERFLHPETASQYTDILKYVVGAKKFSDPLLLQAGDPVEIDPEDDFNNKRTRLFPRGDVLRGTLIKIIKPKEPFFDGNTTDEEKQEETTKWRKKWIYEVKIGEDLRQFSKENEEAGVEPCRHVLFDFDHVGIRALDEQRLQVELKSRTPFFLYLMEFYPTFPVNRKCIETHGYPAWTRAENIVTNGPFLLEYRNIRERSRFVKNPDDWDSQSVQLNVVDALVIESSTTALNMYLDDQVDWVMAPPPAVVPVLEKRDDYLVRPTLTIYFYRINVNRPPFDKKETRTVDGKEIVIDQGKLIRQALNMAIDKAEICQYILRAGQQPARSFVPPGLKGYESAQCGEFNVEKAKALLAEAGFEGGRNLPPMDLLYNTSKEHKQIAEAVSQLAAAQQEQGEKVLRVYKLGQRVDPTAMQSVLAPLVDADVQVTVDPTAQRLFVRATPKKQARFQ